MGLYFDQKSTYRERVSSESREHSTKDDGQPLKKSLHNLKERRRIATTIRLETRGALIFL